MTKKILLIEDEEPLITLLERKLIKVGYSVVLARDGEEGLAKAAEESPDLILLDIVMPKKDGFEVLADLKKNPRLKDIPVVIISNSGQPVEIDKARELGVADWLIKTQFDPQEVIEKIEKQIGK